MMIYWVNCEWDLGFENMFFDSEEKAKQFAIEQLSNYMPEETFDLLKGENLISIENALVN